MTENKRFGFEMDGNCYKCIVDTVDKKLYTDKKQIIDLLNVLYDENEQLKEERNYFERKKCEYFNKYNKKHLDNIQLKEENEQLKKDIEYWKQVASQYSNELNVFKHCKKYKTECKDIYWSSD